MNTRTMLTLSAIYLALVGLGLLFIPDTLEFGILAGLSPLLVTALRQFGGALIGIAVMNWMARVSADAGRVVSAGNVAGYGLVALGGIYRLYLGDAPASLVFVIINLLFAAAFLSARKGLKDEASPAEQ